MRKFFQELFTHTIKAWNNIWFRETDTLVLDFLRIGIGLVLLCNYGFLILDFDFLYTDSGWVSVNILETYHDSIYIHSVLSFIKDPQLLFVSYIIFLFACAAFTLGLLTRWVKWFVLFFHLYYFHRNPAIVYGVDFIILGILIPLVLAPIGQVLSLDRYRKLNQLKRKDLSAVLPVKKIPWGYACKRLIQLQMVICLFFAAIYKLDGSDWINGDALWYALNGNEFKRLPLEWLASSYWIINILTYGTIFLQLGYTFLIWGRRTRPFFLAEIVLVHIGIAVMLDLILFSAVMILGHLSFFRREWLATMGQKWKSWMDEMEVIYDGQCAFCVRSMASLLAFDGLKQITIRDYRTNPSPVVESEKVDKALYVVTGKGQAIPGFDAYRYMVVRIPGLIWLAPLFYIPVLSRLVGRPVYNWIASHRHVISTCVVNK
ncbi:MAG: DUF393 domain-containing protein [Alphaproteobacteria bacterium]|jgi:predicted DCC family thiol-disulfide oxidoreductase YuxK|nr:DUF393 domain-containing protein [Alphaproteobacteria bacterium]MBT5389914.1 DUF393 domain-containing protein [Alphaproteobacteria bacterium]MBT5655141.1 DUF393 domain-containing protein [Alphaproteobacteria bacterium]